MAKYVLMEQKEDADTQPYSSCVSVSTRILGIFGSLEEAEEAAAEGMYLDKYNSEEHVWCDFDPDEEKFQYKRTYRYVLGPGMVHYDGFGHAE